MYPANFHRVVLLQFFNTHGTEVTPGSDVVGEYVQDDSFWHVCLSEERKFLSTKGVLTNFPTSSYIQEWSASTTICVLRYTS